MYKHFILKTCCYCCYYVIEVCEKEIQNINQNGDSSEDEDECAEDDDVFNKHSINNVKC